MGIDSENNLFRRLP